MIHSERRSIASEIDCSILFTPKGNEEVRLRGYAATARQTSPVGNSLWKAGLAGLDEARRR